MTKFSDSLKTVQVKTLFPEKRPALVSIQSTANVAEAFKLLKDHQISSVPVLDKSLGKPRYTAFVDVIDIVAHVITKMTREDLLHFQGTPPLFHKFTVADIVGASNRNPFHPVEETAPLEVAFKLMAKWHVHRIPVVDAEGNLETVVTQSHVIKYIHEQKYLLKDLLSRSVKDLELGTVPVVAVPGDTCKLIEAFGIIFEKKLSAVGVLNESGHLVGNLSASDIKRFGYADQLFHHMYLPVGNFLKVLHDPAASVGNIHTLRETATFEEVLNALTAKKIHRVYITDFEGKPLRIISLTDILTHLFDQ